MENTKCQNLIENYKKLIFLKGEFDLDFLDAIKSKDFKEIKIIEDSMKSVLDSIKSILININYEKIKLVGTINFRSENVEKILGVDYIRMVNSVCDFGCDNNFFALVSGDSRESLLVCSIDRKSLEIKKSYNLFDIIKANIGNGFNFLGNISTVSIKKSMDNKSFIAKLGNCLYFINKDTKKVEHVLKCDNGKSIMSFIENGDDVVYTSNDGNIRIYSKKEKMVIKKKTKFDKNEEAYSKYEFNSSGLLLKTNDDKIALFYKKNESWSNSYVLFFDKNLNFISFNNLYNRAVLVNNKEDIDYNPMYPGHVKVEESIDGKSFLIAGLYGFGIIDKEANKLKNIYTNVRTDDVNSHDQVTNFIQSPDGKYVVLFYSENCGGEEKVKVLDLETFEIVKGPEAFFDGKNLWANDVMLCGNKIISGHDDGTIRRFGNKN